MSNQDKLRTLKPDLPTLLNDNRKALRHRELSKILILVILLSCVGIILSGCGPALCTVVDKPPGQLPAQYKHNYPPLPSTLVELIGHWPTTEADIGVMLKNAAGPYNQCRNSYNALWPICEQMIEATPLPAP